MVGKRGGVTTLVEGGGGGGGAGGRGVEVEEGGDGGASNRKVSRNTDEGSIPMCASDFFPKPTLSADSLTMSVQPPVCDRVHQHLRSR